MGKKVGDCGYVGDGLLHLHILGEGGGDWGSREFGMRTRGEESGEDGDGLGCLGI